MDDRAQWLGLFLGDKPVFKAKQPKAPKSVSAQAAAGKSVTGNMPETGPKDEGADTT
jgi:hypothetical protein